jgi:SPP1 gp7 family putative phage head morphogenesis protein
MLERVKALFGAGAVPQKPLEIPPESLQKESAWAYRSDLISLMGGIQRYNPDDLIAKKGADIYRRMLRDPQIRSAYDMRVNVVISRGWRFEKTSDDQDQMVDLFERSITEWFHGTFVQAMRSILTAKAYGFSVNEKVFETIEHEGRIYWVCRAIKLKPFDTFEFAVDEFGNLQYLLQHQDQQHKKLRPEKFIIYVNRPETDPAYGESDLRACYRAYWEKDVILKLRNIYLERHAGGFLLATAQENAQSLTPTEQVAFDSVLRNIQTMSAVRAPVGYDMEIIQANETKAFDDAINFSDRQFTKALLLPNLLGFSDEGKFGSRALGDTQLDAFMMSLSEEGEHLADTLNEQLFAQLAYWNFGRRDFPQFCLEPYTVSQKRQIAETWIAAVKDGVVTNTFDDENRTRELLQYPPITEEQIEDETPDEPEPAPTPEEIEAPDEPDEPEPEMQAADVDTIELLDQLNLVDRVDFAELDKRLISTEQLYVEQMSDAVDVMYADLKESLTAVFESDDRDPERIKIKSASKDALNKSMRKNLERGYNLGRSEAQKTLNKMVKDAPKSIKDRVKLAGSLSEQTATAKPAIFLEGMQVDQWSVAQFIDGITLQQAVDYFKSRAFLDTKGVTDDMVDAAANVLMQAIQGEWSLGATIVALNEVLAPIIGSDQVSELTGKAKRLRLENIARTSTTSIFNQAMVAAYSDPALGDFIQGYEYSAILDSRTTDICDSLHGKRYKKNDPIWGAITPPNHFMCRSTLIPLSVIDEWAPSKKTGIVPPSKGFGSSAI